jgi:CRP-like cAMP-binding protein
MTNRLGGGGPSPADACQWLRNFLPGRLAVTERDLLAFQSSLTLVHLGKGDRLLARVSEPIRGLVTEGCLRSFFTESDGTDRILYFAPEGWCVGSISAAAGDRPPLVAVDALERTDLWVADRRAQVAEADQPVCDRIWRALAESALLALQERLIGGLRKTAAQRYLDFRRLYPGLDMRIPQYHVAGYLGVSPEFLSRLRKRLIRGERPPRRDLAAIRDAIS